MDSDDDLSDDDMFGDDSDDDSESDDDSDDEVSDDEIEMQASFKDVMRTSVSREKLEGKLDKFQRIAQTPTERFESAMKQEMYESELDVSQSTQSKILEKAQTIPDYLNKNPKLLFLSIHYFFVNKNLSKDAILKYKVHLDKIPLADFLRYLNLVRRTI
jgi:hypothetical protein